MKSLVQCAICQNPMQTDLDSRCPLHPQRLMLPLEDFKQMDPFLGLVLDEKYELRKILGRGGFGAVYEAVQRGQIRQKVAIKLLTQQQAGYHHLFIDEMTVISQLRSPYTVRYLDSGIHYYQNQPMTYMVMELLNGHTLAHHILHKGTLSVRQCAYFGKQLLYSLIEAHELGIIHRDLKPLNIMIVKIPGLGECMKVLDFGIAKLVDQESREATKNRIMGTPYYLAPEILLGHKITTQVDLFSVGVILYEAYQRRSPFLNEDLPGIEPYLRLRNDYKEGKKYLPLSANTPNELQYFFQKALAISPQERFQNANDMIEVLIDLERKLDMSFYEDDVSFAKNNPHSINMIPKFSQTPPVKINYGDQGDQTAPLPSLPGLPNAQNAQNHAQNQQKAKEHNYLDLGESLSYDNDQANSNAKHAKNLNLKRDQRTWFNQQFMSFILPLSIVFVFVVIAVILFKKQQKSEPCALSHPTVQNQNQVSDTLKSQMVKIQPEHHEQEFPCEKDEDCEVKSCRMPTFRIQAQEVSQQDYMACVQMGKCNMPLDKGCNTKNRNAQSCVNSIQAQQYCQSLGLEVPSIYAWTIAVQTLSQPENQKYHQDLEDFFGGLDELVSLEKGRYARLQWKQGNIVKTDLNSQMLSFLDGLGFRCILNEGEE
jgi:serine/threonine protein kinase